MYHVISRLINLGSATSVRQQAEAGSTVTSAAMALEGLGQPKSAYCKPLRVQNAAVQVQSLLDKEAGEEWIGGWPGVGIYEG